MNCKKLDFNTWSDIAGCYLYNRMVDQGRSQELDFPEQFERELDLEYEKYLDGKSNLAQKEMEDYTKNKRKPIKLNISPVQKFIAVIAALLALVGFILPYLFSMKSHIGPVLGILLIAFIVAKVFTLEESGSDTP